MKKLIIFDYKEGEVHIYSVKSILTAEEAEDLIFKFGHDPENCECMIVENDECIIKH